MKDIGFIFILSILFFSGCITFNRKTYNYPDCYNDKNTGLDTMLNLNGYYLLIDSTVDKVNPIPDELQTNYAIFFYKDGFFAQSFYDKNSKYDEKDFDWGLYKICNDTLKIKFVRSGLRKWRYFGKAWYVIKDKNTIKALFFRYNGIVPNEMIKNTANTKKYYAKFILYDTLPDPNKARIKKDKYFWCNKEQYKEWKKQQKMQKHKN